MPNNFSISSKSAVSLSIGELIPIIIILPDGHIGLLFRKNSLIILLSRFRRTAPPVFREMEIPNSVCPDSESAVVTLQNFPVNRLDFSPFRTSKKFERPLSLAFFPNFRSDGRVLVVNSDYSSETESLDLPLARRRFSMVRPALVDILLRKP